MTPVDPESGERYGYLPPKSLDRKVVMRVPLGLRWVFGAIAVALVLLIAGTWYFLRDTSTPAGVSDEGPVARYAEGEVTPLLHLPGWLDRRGGLVAFSGDLAFCQADGGWVDAEDRRYDSTGAGVGTSAGLIRWSVEIRDGHVFVDTRKVAPSGGGLSPVSACTSPREADEPPEADGL